MQVATSSFRRASYADLLRKEGHLAVFLGVTRYFLNDTGRHNGSGYYVASDHRMHTSSHQVTGDKIDRCMCL
jgi:hypothetical protein